LFAQLLRGGTLTRPVVIEGPPGIGKTRLIAELRAGAGAEGLNVLSAQGSDLEREFPFGVVRQLYEPLLSDREIRERLLDGAAATATSVFESVAHASEGDGDVSFAALHGLYWLTVNLASEGRLLLAVDDLHWCDRPSLRFLAYLARRLEGLDALLVVGLRTAEPGTDPVMIGEIAAANDVLHVHPGPLTEAGVADLVRSRLQVEPEPEFVAACRSATGGNPLLLRQLLTSLESDITRSDGLRARAVEEIGPRAVSRTVLLRLRRLAPAATGVAQAVAVLSNNAELPLVAALTGLEEPEVARATAALARAEILKPDPPLGFVHPLVRDAVYHGLPPGERELLHASAARLLLTARAPAEAVATHLLAAPRRGDESVAQLLRDAAASARRKGAADSAVAYLDRALHEPPPEGMRVEVVRELGMAEMLVSGPAAAEHLREAWRGLEDPRERARVAATLARTLMFTAPAGDAVDVARQALAETPAELVDERQALRALELMAVFFGAGDQSEMTRLDEIETVGAGPGAKMLGATVSFCRAVTGSSAEATVPMALDALADGVLFEADPGLFPVGPIFVLVLADRPEALTAWDQLRELAHRRGSLLGILTVGLWEGATRVWRGELREAQELLEAAHRDFLSWGLARTKETYGPAFLGAVRLLRGDLAGARALLDPAALEDARGDGERHLLRAWAELLLIEGRAEEALATAEDLADRMDFVVHPGWAPWRSIKARALDRLQRRTEALELAREDLGLARRFGAPGIVGRTLSLVGRLQGEAGIADMEEAVALLEQSEAKYELTVALLTLGSALRRARRPTEAREPLRRALELADVCGADPLVEEAKSELYAAGARPRSRALQGAGSLTASERRVVDLAVEGRSNKEIAQTLYVTLKTVEVHLSNAYRKLNIRSRQQLGEALAA
jgi:DNA-binding CsgD family transcriptional regulator